LPRPDDGHVHAVAPAVAVRVELRLDPELLADPGGGIGERGNDLRLPVDEDRARRRRRLLRSRRGREDRREREGACQRGSGADGEEGGSESHIFAFSELLVLRWLGRPGGPRPWGQRSLRSESGSREGSRATRLNFGRRRAHTVYGYRSSRTAATLRRRRRATDDGAWHLETRPARLGPRALPPATDAADAEAGAPGPRAAAVERDRRHRDGP